ncbi:hypothetical protein GMPD_27820 [Geomonas paludis]|uniref:Uncharacterized protein n=1 Tax=Geomonas paludis TaxID=2740185 RepID=A0A6V8MZB8_9BACT|nr:hypothetical protein GMPD_27820 [Geomonas paludis]
MLIVENQRGGDAKQTGDDQLRTRTVGQGQRGFLAEHCWGELEGSDCQADNLHDPVLPIVSTNPVVGQSQQICETTDLEAVPSSNSKAVTPFFEFFYYRLEKGDMGRIV